MQIANMFRREIIQQQVVEFCSNFFSLLLFCDSDCFQLYVKGNIDYEYNIITDVFFTTMRIIIIRKRDSKNSKPYSFHARIILFFSCPQYCYYFSLHAHN